jgi:hypothetical protein
MRRHDIPMKMVRTISNKNPNEAILVPIIANKPMTGLDTLTAPYPSFSMMVL